MKARARVSPLEWEIMEVIWTLGGSPCVRDVLEAAYPDGEKAYTTVQTVMNNLERKGLLRKKKIGLVNFYTPVRRRKQMVGGETKRFVERVFSGSFEALASYLIQSDSLTQDEIADLKRLIERQEQADKGDR